MSVATRFSLIGLAAVALAIFAGVPRASAICLDIPGDVNNSLSTNVADASCTILLSLWETAGGTQPGCAQGEPERADVNCSGTINVADVQLIIRFALGQSLDPAIDVNGDNCPDTCDVCGNPVLPDGTPCDDGNACTLVDTCQSGACFGFNPVTCTALDQCHDAGICDPDTGTCSNPLKANGTACDDGNACTQTDACQAGACAGGNPKICPAPDQCHLGICNAATGACSVAQKANGSPCNDGNNCTLTDQCQSGSCLGGNPKVCTPLDGCHSAGVCAPATGICSDPVRPDGTPCDDGDACTQSDTCLAGTCVGSNPIECTPLDQCHVAGACNPSTGVCSNPNIANGTPCDDGSACTQTDTCQSGLCMGSNPVICTALDDCHAAGTCNPASGVCSDPLLADGTPCSDGNACTQTDTCVAGTCTGSNPIDCPALDQCHVGICDPGNGSCSDGLKPNGSPCDDGNACTQTDTCQDGVCVGSNPVVCSPIDDCHGAGECNTATGTCSTPVLPDNTPCSDQNACTTTDRCQAGACVPGPAVVCTAQSQCHDVGTCNPTTGICSNPEKPANTPCDDANACTQSDTCQAGTCVGADPVICTPIAECYDPGTCNPSTGICSTPLSSDGSLCEDGNPNTCPDTCTAGTCNSGPTVNCTDGNPCTDDACIGGTCQNTPNTVPCGNPALCLTGFCDLGLCFVQMDPCDDDNPCTDDSCDGAGTCLHANNTQPCDDGNACTTGDHCENGACTPTSFETCNDGNPCTDDICLPQGGCLFVNNAAPCNDGNPCTQTDTCGAGSCSGAPVVCPPSTDPCIAATCDPGTGACGVVMPDNSPCDDDNACTNADRCIQGICAGLPAPECDTGGVLCEISGPAGALVRCDFKLARGRAANPAATAGQVTLAYPTEITLETFTDRACLPFFGCFDYYLPSGSQTLFTGHGLSIAPIDLQDWNGGGQFLAINPGDTSAPFTDAAYADGVSTPMSGEPIWLSAHFRLSQTILPTSPAVVAASAIKMSDFNAKSLSAVVYNGVIVTNPYTVTCTNFGGTCDDGNPCTGVGTCVQGYCVANPEPNGSACSDGNACTSGDTCHALECLGTAVQCNDGNACNGTETCNTATGCVAGTNPVVCTPLDTCHDAGVCQPSTGTCTNPEKTNGSTCTDGNACTLNDTCLAGVCIPGAPKTCGDGNECTTDTCSNGDCFNTPNSGPCDQGNQCSIGQCSAGVCQTVGVGCDDFNPCTDDSCVPALGCVFTPNTQPCTDNNACTANDVCAGGACVGAPLNCNDNNQCTTDSCDVLLGCQYAVFTGTCDDGNPCTTSDFCTSSGCLGFETPCPASGDPCMLDVCDPGTGLCGVPLPEGGACDDGEACTLPDTCSGGVCSGPAYPGCDEPGANILCLISGQAGAIVSCPLKLGRLYNAQANAAALQVTVSYPASVRLVSFTDEICFAPEACFTLIIPDEWSTLSSGHSLVLAPSLVASWSGIGEFAAVNASLASALTTATLMGNPNGSWVGDPVYLTANWEILTTLPTAAPAEVVALDATVSDDNATPMKWKIRRMAVRTEAYTTPCSPNGAPCTDPNECVDEGICINSRCVTPNLPDGTPCDDGDPCTQDDECIGGECTPGAPIPNCP